MPQTKALLDLQQHETLSEYVTAIAWSPDGQTLAASSASGEVILYTVDTGHIYRLQPENERSVDCLAFSHDGQWLATGGQDGAVRIWQLQLKQPQLLHELTHSRIWIDCLQWNHHHPELAFSLGRHVQVWNAQTQAVVTTLHYETSSVLDVAWHPKGTHLSMSGNQAIKTWDRQAWDDDPQVWETSAASMAIAWSPNGQYLAAGNTDRTLLVWEWGNPYPWQMQGFPGKVRQLSWSTPLSKTGAPILASISTTGIVVWSKSADSQIGWEATVLERHRDKVTAIAFQPDSLLLASTSEDGSVCLWKNAKQLVQTLQDSPNGFSCLAWHPQGQQLAAGGQNGELIVWAKSSRGKGFG